MKKRGSYVSLVLCLFAIESGCGIDVGNAGKPAPTAVNPTYSLADIVSAQHSETIDASLAISDQDSAKSAMALFALQAGTVPNCTEDASDGSVTIKRDESTENSRELGKPAKRRLLTDTFQWTSTAQVKPSAGAIVCQEGRPKVQWSQTKTYTSTLSYSKTRSRQLILKKDASPLASSNLSASGDQKETVTLLSQNDQTIELEKIITRSSSVTIKRTSDTTPFQQNVSSLEGEPLVIHVSRTKGIKRSVTIVSGAIVASSSGAAKTLLRYDHLILGNGASCQPSSGSIAGEYYDDDHSLVPSKTFQIIFTVEGATLVTSDGQEEELDLEDCSL